jgi:ornithine cyclodeaminase/alanine dehydrogenase-like protein (mu-crystallin family)
VTPAFHAPEAIARRGHLPRLVRELEVALREGLHDRAQVPMRQTLVQPEPAAAFLSMPALSSQIGIYLDKVATIFPRAAGDPRPTVTALVVAFSTLTGELLAMLDGAAVTNLKCAAVSALVTDACAHPTARILALAGTGVQAWQQVRAVCSVRPIEELRVWARDPAAAARFCAELRNEANPSAPSMLLPCATLEQAVRGADIVATATAARTPLAPLSAFGDLPPHVHLNCMGGHTAESRELPRELLRTSTLVVEHLATAIAEAGDVHAGALALGELLQQEPAALRGRRTIFSSTGHAFLDLITTAHLLRELASGESPS